MHQLHIHIMRKPVQMKLESALSGRQADSCHRWLDEDDILVA